MEVNTALFIMQAIFISAPILAAVIVICVFAAHDDSRIALSVAALGGMLVSLMMTWCAQMMTQFCFKKLGANSHANAFANYGSI